WRIGPAVRAGLYGSWSTCRRKVAPGSEAGAESGTALHHALRPTNAHKRLVRLRFNRYVFAAPATADHALRRGGRVVECTALEMRHGCKPIGGSNPSLSAILAVELSS